MDETYTELRTNMVEMINYKNKAAEIIRKCENRLPGIARRRDNAKTKFGRWFYSKRYNRVNLLYGYAVTAYGMSSGVIRQLAEEIVDL